jgi:signal transduction histidine kinase
MARLKIVEDWLLRDLVGRLLGPRRLLAVMVVFYGVACAVVAGLLVWTDRADTEDHLELLTGDVARLLDEHASRTLDSVELVVMRAADRVQMAGGVPQAAAAPATRQVLTAMAQATPHIGNIYLVDAGGRVAFDMGGFHPPGTSFAERDWVAALSAKDASTFIGQVRFDDATRSHSFTVARRIRSDSGEFLGIAAATVEVDYFKKFYVTLGVGPSPAFGIYRLDGAALVRVPLRPEDIGRNFASNPIFVEHVARAANGTYHGRSPYDGIMRIVSYRTIEPRRLLVWVAVGEDDALAQWRQRSQRTLALMVAAFLLAAGLSVLLSRQIERERRATAALAAVNDDLKRSNADLEQFAYVASHDLKEPLRSIASYIQLLQRRYQGRLDADADAFIGYAVEGVRRLQVIINELLAFSRLGSMRPQRAPVQAGAAVSAALTALKNVIAEAQAAVEIEGQLPVVEADGAQLVSLFQNLIGNGLKYRRDDVRPEVTVGCEDCGDKWQFHVRDNGIGIDAAHHSHIFEAFKRLHPHDRYSGTGIGLAICKRVVERHGGRIWVDSEPGKGSTFYFTLPKSGGG